MVEPVEAAHRQLRVRAADLFGIGIFMIFLEIVTLASNSCSPECSVQSGVLLVVTFYGGIVVCLGATALGLYRVAISKTDKLAVVKNGFRIQRSRRRTLTGVAGIALIVILSFYSIKSVNRPEWVFNGAYAKYSVSGLVRPGESFHGNLTFKVINFNSTFARAVVYTNYTSAATTVNHQDYAWTRTNSVGVVYAFAGGTLSSRTSTTYNFNGKVVPVTVFVFKSNESGEVQTYYTSNIVVGTPLTFVLTDQVGENVTGLLIQTNIPGLKP